MKKITFTNFFVLILFFSFFKAQAIDLAIEASNILTFDKKLVPTLASEIGYTGLMLSGIVLTVIGGIFIKKKKPKFVIYIPDDPNSFSGLHYRDGWNIKNSAQVSIGVIGILTGLGITIASGLKLYERIQWYFQLKNSKILKSQYMQTVQVIK